MEIDPRYASFVVPVFGLCVGLWYKITRSDEKIKTIWGILFKEKGGLNVVTHETLKESIEGIEKTIQRESDITSKILERLECLNENVIALMVHSKLKAKRVKTIGNQVTVYKDILP